MFHGRKKIRKIITKLLLKVLLEKGGWNIVLFGNFTKNKLVISK